MVVYPSPAMDVLGLQLSSRLSYVTIYATASLDVWWIVQQWITWRLYASAIQRLKAINQVPGALRLDIFFLIQKDYTVLCCLFGNFTLSNIMCLWDTSVFHCQDCPVTCWVCHDLFWHPWSENPCFPRVPSVSLGLFVGPRWPLKGNLFSKWEPHFGLIKPRRYVTA